MRPISAKLDPVSTAYGHLGHISALFGGTVLTHFGQTRTQIGQFSSIRPTEIGRMWVNFCKLAQSRLNFGQLCRNERFAWPRRHVRGKSAPHERLQRRNACIVLHAALAGASSEGPLQRVERGGFVPEVRLWGRPKIWPESASSELGELCSEFVISMVSGNFGIGQESLCETHLGAPRRQEQTLSDSLQGETTCRNGLPPSLPLPVSFPKRLGNTGPNVRGRGRPAICRRTGPQRAQARTNLGATHAW